MHLEYPTNQKRSHPYCKLNMDDNLLSFRKNSETTLTKSQDDFEKQLVYISGGALTVSMFLIEKVVKDLPHASCKWVLIACWTMLGFTLIVSLLSHFLCINFNYKTIEEIDADTYNPFKARQRNRIIKTINVSTFITLVLGIILLIIFTSINL